MQLCILLLLLICFSNYTFGQSSCDPSLDVDGDGFSECNDNCPLIFNPNQADFDNDGIGDVCDNCPGTINLEQADNNGDGVGDACQNCVGECDQLCLDIYREGVQLCEVVHDISICGGFAPCEAFILSLQQMCVNQRLEEIQMCMNTLCRIDENGNGETDCLEGQSLITTYSLIDAQSGQITREISTGAIIDYSLDPFRFTIVAETDPEAPVESAEFELIGPDYYLKRKENLPPYSLFGDNVRRGTYGSRTDLPLGDYTLNIRLFDQDHLKGEELDEQTLNFTLAFEPTLDKVVMFETAKKYEVIEDVIIAEIGDDMKLDYNDLGTSRIGPGLLLPAVQKIRSAKIKLYFKDSRKALLSKTENYEPYALGGDNTRRNFFYPLRRLLDVGHYTLTIIPFTGKNGRGIPGTEKVLNFSMDYSAQLNDFVVVRADRAPYEDSDLFSLSEQSIIDYKAIDETYGTSRINIRAEFADSEFIESVRYTLLDEAGNIKLKRIENIAPYALGGDNPRRGYYYKLRNLKEGTYTLLATPHFVNRAKGQGGKTLELQFTVGADNGASEPGNTRTRIAKAEPTIPSQVMLEEELPEEDLFIYPNPSNGVFQVEFIDLEGLHGFTIYDLMGKIVLKKERGEFDSSALIDLTGYGRGVYLMNVFTTSGTLSRRLIVR